MSGVVEALDLRHYAASAVTLNPRTYEQQPGFKPAGFWVSVGAAWADWCRGAEFRLDTVAYEHRVTLVADANVLRVGTVAALDALTATYLAGDGYYIDWPAVADGYAGIMIAPYQWSRRFELLWYYGWDCASGCIWDLSAVSEVELEVAMSSGVEWT